MSKIYYNYDEANGEVHRRNANHRFWVRDGIYAVISVEIGKAR